MAQVVFYNNTKRNSYPKLKLNNTFLLCNTDVFIIIILFIFIIIFYKSTL